MAIEFFSTKGEYGAFSNFAPYGAEMGGEWYPTSEHYFQAMKFHDKAYRERIRKANSPMIAARLGRSRKVKLRDDWESVKIDVMRDVVRKKFTTHAELSDLLISTGQVEITESAPRDYFWGCGADGSGQNRLGRILMEVREGLQQKGRDIA